MKLLNAASFKSNPFSENARSYFSVDGALSPINSLSLLKEKNSDHLLMSFNSSSEAPYTWGYLLKRINESFKEYEEHHAIAGISATYGENQYYLLNKVSECAAFNAVIFNCVRDHI